MDSNSSSNGGLGKLLPKSMVKRRRRLNKGPRESDQEEERGRGTLSREISLDSDDTMSMNMADDEDVDGRSFGSFESGGAEPDRVSLRSSSRPPPPRQTSTLPQPGYHLTSPAVPQSRRSGSHTDLRSLFRPRSAHGTSSKDSSLNASKEAVNEQTPPIPPLPELPPAARTASPDKRTRELPPKISTDPPRTPPQQDDRPLIVNTPPTPTGGRSESAPSSSPDRRLSRIAAGPSSNGDGTIVSKNLSIHRRAKSGSVTVGPSKLSNITSAPLTPTPENGEPTSSSTGFFSSMFSAAQNAANTISSNIQNTNIGIGGNKGRAASSKAASSPAASQADIEEPQPEPQPDESMDMKESAVRTIGSGELSLSQLGILEPTITMSPPEHSRFPDLLDTRARSESAPADSQSRGPEIITEDTGSRPRSLYDGANVDPDGAASQSDFGDGKVDMQRSASVRSDQKPYRKRGSSIATAGPVISTLPASSGIPPSVSAPKLTGFAIASKKRNRDFHSLFKSVPDDDYLIEDYSCALQREILAHGRLYVSEGHLCFSSNILGWVTTLVMSFDEIVSVEKRSTALVFKNGLMISTLHAKHIFASFTSRDATYDLIVNIWKLGHPTLKSTLNGVRVEGTGGDKTEKIDNEPASQEAVSPAGSDSEDDSEDEEEDFYDEEETEQMPETQITEISTTGGEVEKTANRKASGAATLAGAPVDAVGDGGSLPPGAAPFPGPIAHAPTDCGDAATHYDKILADEVIPAPMGKIFSFIFGEASPEWMGKWLTENQKCFDLQMEDKKGMGPDNRTRSFSYIKPLYASIGPRQTKCMVTETIDNIDFEKVINVNMTTQNPDVPSGNIFRVKTKYCLTWAENNATRVQVNCTTEWSGKSWLKGPIEKNVNEGQAQYCKDLFAALRIALSSRVRSSTNPNGAAKLKRKGKKGKALQSSTDLGDASLGAKSVAEKNWGLLEPIRPILEPVLDLLKPLLTGNIVYGLLVGLLVATWFGFGFSPSRNAATADHDLALHNPYRFAAYEEMWRREESDLWEWLDERVGLERLAVDTSNARKRVAEPRTFENRLRDERMDEREVEEAIRVTEEKLKVLKGVMSKSKPM